jgi:hypothetical protein
MNQQTLERKRRHDAAKARYKAEMDELQMLEKSYEEKLHALQRSKWERKATSHDRRSGRSIWEGFARRQAIERQEVQLENTRLKHSLEVHQKTLAALEAVVRQHQKQSSTIDPLGPYRVRMEDMMHMCLPLDESARRSIFNASMDAQFGTVPYLLDRHGLAPLSSGTWKQVRIRTEPNHERLSSSHNHHHMRIVLELSFRLRVHVAPTVLADTIYAAYYPRQTSSYNFMRIPNGSADILQNIDALSHCIRRIYRLDHGLPDIHAHFGSKFFMGTRDDPDKNHKQTHDHHDDQDKEPREPGLPQRRRILMTHLLQTIQDDAKFPIPSDVWRSQEIACMTVEEDDTLSSSSSSSSSSSIWKQYRRIVINPFPTAMTTMTTDGPHSHSSASTWPMITSPMTLSRGDLETATDRLLTFFSNNMEFGIIYIENMLRSHAGTTLALPAQCVNVHDSSVPTTPAPQDMSHPPLIECNGDVIAFNECNMLVKIQERQPT